MIKARSNYRKKVQALRDSTHGITILLLSRKSAFFASENHSWNKQTQNPKPAFLGLVREIFKEASHVHISELELKGDPN